MNWIYAHYEEIFGALYTLIVFIGLACLSALGLWLYFAIERAWAGRQRRHRRFAYRGQPGAFKSRPYRS